MVTPRNKNWAPCRPVLIPRPHDVRKVVSIDDDVSCCIGGRRELEERRRTDLGLYTRGMRDGSLAGIVIDSIIITTGNERRW